MNKQKDSKRKIQVWLPLLFAITMIAGMLIGYNIRSNMPQSVSFFKLPSKRAPLQEILDLINMKYVDSVNVDTLGNDAIEGILHRLDPHSVYIPASKLSEINEDLQGNFQGIGVEYQIIKDTVNVTNIIPGGPSANAGLQVGDKLIKVNDSVVAGNGITSEKIKKLLRGPGNSIVNVTLLRDGKPVTRSITRGIIPLPSLDAAYMLTKDAGYIRLNKFSSTTYAEFRKAMEGLLQNGLKELVLDLRGNGGGILDEAVDIADEFLDGDKLIVYTKGDHTSKQEYHCKRPGLFETGKLIVLVDENSASASEVLTGALQDWDRATIIGRRTFGKGLVQEQFALNDGAALRLTVARYYTPTGRSIQKPYTHDGKGDYQNDLNNRFEHGDLISADSNKVKNGEAFITKSGRTVYGGGGIMPDIFVAIDTSGRFLGKVARLYSSNTLNKFVYSYYMQHKNELNVYKTVAEFVKGYQVNETAWNEFENIAMTDSVSIKGIALVEKQFLTSRIKALIARQLWRNEGYYEVLNAHDDVLEKAEAELAK